MSPLQLNSTSSDKLVFKFGNETAVEGCVGNESVAALPDIVFVEPSLVVKDRDKGGSEEDTTAASTALAVTKKIPRKSILNLY